MTIDALTAMVLERDRRVLQLEMDVLGWRTLTGLFARRLMGPTVPGVGEQGGMIRVPDRLIGTAEYSQKVYLERRASTRGWEVVVTGPDLVSGYMIVEAKDLSPNEEVGAETILNEEDSEEGLGYGEPLRGRSLG